MIRGSLEWFLAPTDPAAFLQRHFEQRPLHVRGDAERYRGLPTLADVDRAITHLALLHPQVRMANDGEILAPDSFTRKGGVVDPVLAAERIAEGATLIVDAVESWSARVARLCRVFARRIMGSAWANLYLTPRRSRGFSPHADDHDVFVLHLAGEKQWFLYAPPAEFPPLTPVARGKMPVGAPVSTPTLRPGDLLYIPRGHPHAAAAHADDTLHLTIGFTPATWAVVLRAAVEDFAAQEERARHAVPIGAFRRPGAARAELASMLRALAESADPRRAFHRVHADLAEQRRTLAPGHIAAAFDREPVTLETRVGLRVTREVAQRITGDSLELSLPGRTITLPRHARKAVRFILTHPRFRVADLPDDLDDAGKITLVTRLAREGVLRILRSPPRLA